MSHMVKFAMVVALVRGLLKEVPDLGAYLQAIPELKLVQHPMDLAANAVAANSVLSAALDEAMQERDKMTEWRNEEMRRAQKLEDDVLRLKRLISTQVTELNDAENALFFLRDRNRRLEDNNYRLQKAHHENAKLIQAARNKKVRHALEIRVDRGEDFGFKTVSVNEQDINVGVKIYTAAWTEKKNRQIKKLETRKRRKKEKNEFRKELATLSYEDFPKALEMAWFMEQEARWIDDGGFH